MADAEDWLPELVDGLLSSETGDTLPDRTPSSPVLENDTVRKLFFSSRTAADDDRDLLKAALLTGPWYASDSNELSPQPSVAHRLLFIRVPSKRERKSASGTSLRQLFVLHPAPANGRRRDIALSALLESVPTAADGILFRTAGDDLLAIRRAEFPKLQEVIKECAQHAARLDRSRILEQAIEVPGPGQLPLLFASTWYTAARLCVEEWRGFRCVLIGTRPTYPRLAPIQGDALLPRIAALEPGIDGIAVNPDGPAGAAANVLLGPAFASSALRGIDARAGVDTLHARTKAEMRAWLALHEFPRSYVVLREEEGVFRARAVIENRPLWSVVECASLRSVVTREVVSPPFRVEDPNADRLDLGEGTTTILCAGLLAAAVTRALPTMPSAWNLLVPAETKKEAARLAGWAAELEKHYNSGGLRRESVRTANGACSVRLRKTFDSPDAVRSARKRLERIAR
jgi:hypothetical protein